MKTITLLASICLLITSCQDKDHSFETSLSGYYKVKSIVSTIPVDMNNDGMKSVNIYQEISGPHTTLNDEQISFYNFDASWNFMEIRPLKGTTNNAQLISINFPTQQIDNITTGEFYLMEYMNSFLGYSYKLNDSSNEIELADNNPDYREPGTITQFQMISDSELELKMTTQLFDFIENDWVNTDIVITYQKVD